MADVQWHLSGDYFENCSCSIVCPCLVSAAPPLTARPTEGFCNVPLIFHVESGRYGDIVLDGFNVLVILHAPGVMADGDWSVAAYIDQRANDEQTEALAAIFTGAAGGPMAAFTPLIMHPSGEMWANIGHPVSPDRMVMAVGAAGNTFSDHGMRWDNSGKNGLYAPIRWSNQA